MLRGVQDSRGIPHFELSGVSRCWGKRIALDNVSFEIKPGELIALVGPSGSGKSTLIRLLGGILRPTSGTVRVDDLDIASFSMRDLRKFRARCGVVGQGLNLVPQLSVHQNVVAGCLPHWPWYKVLASGVIPMRRHRVRHILDTLGIADRQWDATTLLSGGQQQRVAIARALITDPRVILADEPTSSLDPRTAEETTKLIVQRARDAGATLVFCTHWYRIVKPYVTRVLGLRDGKIAFDSLQEDVTEKRLDDLYSGSHERI